MSSSLLNLPSRSSFFSFFAVSSAFFFAIRVLQREEEKLNIGFSDTTPINASLLTYRTTSSSTSIDLNNSLFVIGPKKTTSSSGSSCVYLEKLISFRDMFHTV